MPVMDAAWCAFNGLTVFLIQLENKDEPMPLLGKLTSKRDILLKKSCVGRERRLRETYRSGVGSWHNDIPVTTLHNRTIG